MRQNGRCSWAQDDLKSSGLDEKKIVPILYRPFDVRYTYYTGKTRGFHSRPRTGIMKNMIEKNFGLIVGRQWGAIGSNSYDIVFISNKITDYNIFRRGGGQIFPLYLQEDSGKIPNINQDFIKYLYKKYGIEPSPEEILHYIYAILQSPKYREKYEPFLRYDFPRIPFVDEYSKFNELSEIGEYLTDLHLMKNTLTVKTKFDVEGTNVVGNVKYKDKKVWINKEQYFDEVPAVAWDYNVGGYPVLQHFLKDRKNKKLTNQEIEVFFQIVEIIKLTVVIMKKVDRVLH